MPPPPQKGTGKKGRDRDVRQSRSRNTTPSAASASGSISIQADSSDSGQLGFTALLNLPIQSFRTAEDIMANLGNAIPASADLESLLGRVKTLDDTVKQRGAVNDRGMRLLVEERKMAFTERKEQERKERAKADAADEEERGRLKASKAKNNKRKDHSNVREERPLTHGAHGVAHQDGTHEPNKKPARRMSRDNDSASSSLSPVAQATPAATGMDIDEKDDQGADSSSDERQPPPQPAIPHLQTFGEDPSTFPDPTIYEIKEVTKDMTREERKEIYSVAYFPEHDLGDLIPGSPPDKDFSNAKPTNQVQANTFSTYLEPFFRPLSDEDLAFLRERGERVIAFHMPKRGKKHYTELWAEEDGALSVNPPGRQDNLPANVARGNIDMMDDAIGETDQLSAAPMVTRLLAAMRPEHRAPPEERPASNGLTNGDISMNGDVNGDFADMFQPAGDASTSVPPATFMADSNSDAWKKAVHPKLDGAQVDQRVLQELRHIGFLDDAEPDYDAHYDDPVAARLRTLQAQLKARSIKNAAMKARLLDLAKQKMAHQEFTTIQEDLDSQVQAAYSKRSRSLGKSKKNKRPGGAGGGSHYVGGTNTGMARPGIGDSVKILMERRKKWGDTIGPVLDPLATKVRRNAEEGSSIFKPEDMAPYLKAEAERWEEEVEEE